MQGKKTNRKKTRSKTKRRTTIREEEKRIRNIIENKKGIGNGRMKNII
jgi:hypothetical protein